MFGDLGLPNILVTKDGLKLVDSDWCDKEGEAQYPASLFKEIPWPGGVEGEEKITSAHHGAGSRPSPVTIFDASFLYFYRSA